MWSPNKLAIRINHNQCSLGHSRSLNGMFAEQRRISEIVRLMESNIRVYEVCLETKRFLKRKCLMLFEQWVNYINSL